MHGWNMFEMTYSIAQHIGPIYIGSESMRLDPGPLQKRALEGGEGGSNGTSMTPLDNAVMKVSCCLPWPLIPSKRER